MSGCAGCDATYGVGTIDRPLIFGTDTGGPRRFVVSAAWWRGAPPGATVWVTGSDVENLIEEGLLIVPA